MERDGFEMLAGGITIRKSAHRGSNAHSLSTADRDEV